MTTQAKYEQLRAAAVDAIGAARKARQDAETRWPMPGQTPRKARERIERLAVAADRAEQRFRDALAEVSPRCWDRGIPHWFAVEHASWEWATTRGAIPLVPPRCIGETDPHFGRKWAAALA